MTDRFAAMSNGSQPRVAALAYVNPKFDENTGYASVEEMLRSSIDIIDEAVVIYDADDRLVFCNEK